MKNLYLIIILFLFSAPIYCMGANDSTLSIDSRRSPVSFISFDLGSNLTFFSNYINSDIESNEIIGMTKRARSHFALGLGLNPFNSRSFNFLFAVENNNHDLKAKIHSTISEGDVEVIEYDFNYLSLKFGGLFKLIELGQQGHKTSINLKAGLDGNFLISGFQYKQNDIIDLRDYEPFKNKNLDYFIGVDIQKQITPIASVKLGYTRVKGFRLEEFNSIKNSFEQYTFRTDLISLGILVDLDAVKMRKKQEDEIVEVAENLKKDLKDNIRFKNESEQKFKKLIKQLNDSDKKIEEHSDILDELKELIEQEQSKSTNQNNSSLSDIYSLNENKRLVLFPFGKDKFYSAFNKELDNLVSYVDSNNVKIKLIGYSDIVGSDNYNLNLSKKRAKSVKKYLVSKGVDESIISIEFKGSTTQFDRYNFLFNRRVEINIINE